jgi:hypothetical protein
VERLGNHSTASPETGRLLRILTIGEENGEVGKAVHGVMAPTSARGTAPPRDDVQKEPRP